MIDAKWYHYLFLWMLPKLSTVRGKKEVKCKVVYKTIFSKYYAITTYQELR